jgi:hypothetical protein
MHDPSETKYEIEIKLEKVRQLRFVFYLLILCTSRT